MCVVHVQVEKLLAWCDNVTAGVDSVEAQFSALQQELTAAGADVQRVALEWQDGFRGLKARKRLLDAQRRCLHTYAATTLQSGGSRRLQPRDAAVTHLRT